MYCKYKKNLRDVVGDFFSRQEKLIGKKDLKWASKNRYSLKRGRRNSISVQGVSKISSK